MDNKYILKVFESFDDRLKETGRSMKYYSYRSKIEEIIEEYKSEFPDSNKMEDDNDYNIN